MNKDEAKGENKRKQHHLKKRAPNTLCKRPNDVFISSNVDFQVQAKKCEQLLDSGLKEIYLHCLGKSINRGLHLALSLVNNSSNALTYSIQTSTIGLLDELHPLYEDSEFELQKRNNSIVHIKVYRTHPLCWK